ncbi:MAG TPA: ATP-binding protein [Gemmataceae bacterium]|jgi:two-component system phosphate regulon sensor histidine kinase PhoR
MALLRQYLGYGLLVLLAAGLVGAVLLPDAPAWAVWAVAASAGGVAVLLFDDFRRRRERVLGHATEALRRLAAGKFGHKLYAGGSPALTDLARAVNAAAETLAGRIDGLEAERRQLRAVLGGMVEGVLSLDARQVILFANDRAGELLGFDSAAASGRKFWEVVRHRRLQGVVRAALAGPEPIREELDWTGPAVRHLALYAARLTGPDTGAVVVLHDTTDLRRLERVRQEFVANVSHELKTPLAVIKVCAETLIDGAAADIEARGGFLRQIDEQADRLHALILDLINLARIESGAEALDCQAVPLESAVRDCLDRHRPRAEANGLRLEVAAPAGPSVTAWADEEAVDTILDNLVDNAIKYTQAGGRVAVRWRAADGRSVVEIEDTGIGIPERDQSRVFERFYRVDRARARELGGTGLGLSIVKHLVQAMGGEVGVRSAMGRGTTFTVRLPASPPAVPGGS